MKKTTYIYVLLSLLFTACQDTDYYENGGNETGSVLQFTLDIPEYKVSKRAIDENAVTDIQLLVFDSKGLFIQRVQAQQISSNGNTGAFKAVVSTDASIVHFVANYDKWDTFDDLTAKDKDERELVPELVTEKLVFWGRNTITSLATPINVTLYRNQAKVTVENNTTNFQVTGFALANFPAIGTVAPFNPEGSPTPFILSEDTPTIPIGLMVNSNQTEDDCNLEEKYMCEDVNDYNNQTYVIIKGILDGSTEELYYKIQLLDDLKRPYPIIRNNLYKIVIKVFSQEANGSKTFEDAKSAEASNNIYAEINKVSPTISDTQNNILTVGSTSYLFITGGNLEIPAHYTKNGIAADNEIQVYVLEDGGNILHAIQYDGIGTIRGYVSIVPAGQQEATILVKAGVLSRTITVVSSAYYLFKPMTITPEIYNGSDAPVTISFNIPNNIPNSLFPLECEITTKYLYPVDPNKNLQVEYANGSYKYIYWARTPGTVNLNFKTSLQNSDEFVYLTNKYFIKDSVKLQSRRFTNASINGNNVVNYGANSIAQLTFTVTDADVPAQYPLTVHIKTNNLKTSTAGWTAETGGYYRTFTSAPTGAQTVLFSSKTAISEEQIAISANGFSDTKINMTNVLSTNLAVSGKVYAFYNNQNHTLANNSRLTSSNTGTLPSIRVTSGSNYSITIPSGTSLSDGVTYTYSTYYSNVTVKNLLESPNIILVTP